MSAAQRFLLVLLTLDTLLTGVLIGAAWQSGVGSLWFLAGMLLMAAIWEANEVIEP